MMKLIPLMLVIPLCVAHAQSPPPATATNEPTTGTISGKVVNERGQPMSGATVAVSALNGTIRRTTATDTEGNFQFSGLEPALYTCRANAPAYVSIPPEPNAPPTFYRLGDSVRLELVRGGVITGNVTNSLGEPLVVITVRATMIRDARGKLIKAAGYTAEKWTDDRGVYRMYGLPPGTYLVSAGGFGAPRSFRPNPYDTDLPTFAPSSTRDNASEVSVAIGEEVAVDIRYRGDPGYTVSGTVRYSGPNGASIMLTPVGGFLPPGNTFQTPTSRGFAFHGVADGEYELMAQEVTGAPGSPNPVVSLSEPKRITIKGSSVSGIELVTKPTASVVGRILLEPSQAEQCKGKRAPLFQETAVRVRRSEKDSDKELSPYLTAFMGSATPDQNGTFLLRNIAPGRYQFEPRFFARYWYLQSMTLGTPPPARGAKSVAAATSKTDAAANWTVVKFGDQITNLTITLAEGAASMRGKLLREPAAGTVLYLVPSEQDKAENVLRFFVTEIGVDGTFTLTNLPPGKYWVFAEAKPEAQTETLIKLREPEAAAARSKLRKTAAIQKTEIELSPCQNLIDYELK